MAGEEQIQEKRKKKVGFLLWKLEIICWQCSVCLFVGVVVALQQFKGGRFLSCGCISRRVPLLFFSRISARRS